MNKDIKRLATTLRKGLRNFLGIEQDSEALIGLLDLVTERQKELGKTLLDIQNHNVTFHKVTMSKKVRTLMESLEDDIKSVRFSSLLQSKYQRRQPLEQSDTLTNS